MKKLLGSILIMCFLSIFPCRSWGDVFVIEQLTNNSYDDVIPQINNSGWVTWEAHPGGHSDIYLHKGSGDSINISSNTVNNQNPQINNSGWVTWYGKPLFEETEDDIYLYKGSGPPINISNNPDDNDFEPRINDNGWVTWSKDDGWYSEIYLYGWSGPSINISNNPDDNDFEPRINDSGWVTWVQGSSYEVYLYEGSGNPIQISNSFPGMSSDPQINNSGWVTWTESLGGTSYIYLYKGCGYPIMISNSYYDDRNSRINDIGWVTWQGRASAFSDYAIYLWKGSGDAIIISNSSGDESNPRINNSGWVTWQVQDGNDWEIYLWKGSDDPIQITDNDYDDINPKINNSGVLTWQGKDGGLDWEIYRASTPSNTPPFTPLRAEITPNSPKTNDDLVCTVTPAYPPDVDPEDVAEIMYVYEWICVNCGGKPPLIYGPKIETEYTLDAINTNKDEQWSCKVWAVDGSYAYSDPVTTPPVTIENSPPEGLEVEVNTEDSSLLDPNSHVYITENLVCTVYAPPMDPDDDTITYIYEWRMVGSEQVYREQTTTDTSDTFPKNELKQCETFYCDVTASDGEDTVSATSNQVLVYNRPPTITTSPSAEVYAWEEGGHYEIRINASDPDGNNLTLEIDTNYIDPNDLDWIDFDTNANPPTLIADPPADGSSLDVGYGPGIFKFNFMVTDIMNPGEDPICYRTVNKVIDMEVLNGVQPPLMIVDNFEYPPTDPNLIDNGWNVLQGTGAMLLMQADPGDPSSNHYLKTTVPDTPTNNSQLDYIIYKTIPGNTFNNEYPIISLSVQDRNLYYFDVFLRGKNNAGGEENFFIRYKPEDPPGEWSVSLNYVFYNIGSEYIVPNGNHIKTIERNMEEDLSIATGFQYLYLKGIVLRGDINYLDNIKVEKVVP